MKADVAGKNISGDAELLRSQRTAVRKCPLCGAVERRLVAERDAWQIVECRACKMVFIGNEIGYDEQSAEHDWLDDYPKEMERRKEKHPVLLFLSRYTRRLRPETNARLLKQTMRWKQGGNTCRLRMRRRELYGTCGRRDSM